MIARKTLAVLTLMVLAGLCTPAWAQEPAATPEPAEMATDPAAVPLTEPEPPLYPSRSARDQALLASALSEEVRWLDIPDGQQLALFKPTEDRRTRGALLILQGQAEPAGWHPLLENPRRTLPRHGWATLALNLPASVPLAPPPRPSETMPTEPNGEANTENPATDPASSPEPVTEPTAEPPVPQESTPVTPTREELIEQSLNATLDWLVAENLSPIILMLDASLALDVVAQLETRTQGIPSALVLINLQHYQAFSTAELETLFANPALPVLDVFITSEAARLADIRQRHKAVALRRQLANYRQLELPGASPLTLNDHRSAWVEQLRGFMQLKAQKP